MIFELPQKAMILAAGLGQRMRPLTDNLPKPLLRVGDKPLLDYHLEALSAVGIHEVIINLAYLGEKIRDYVGDGERYGLRVIYSQEPEPLETAGALLRALPLLGEAPFLLINGDVWTDYPLQNLATHGLPAYTDAHLVLVPNPDFHPSGDFALNAMGNLIERPDQKKHTFSGLSVIHPRLINHYPNRREKFPLGEVIRFGIGENRISGEVYDGLWSDVGTPERLFQLDSQIQASQFR